MNSLRIGIFLFCVILAVPAVTAGPLTITEPSENETTFAEMRDIYVYGVFPEPLAHPGNVRVVLKDGSGTVIRTVESSVNESGVTPESAVEMSLVPSKWGGLLAPDVITEPGGIENGSNKLLVTDTYYLALVQGGATRGMGSYTDVSGGALAPITRDLTAGTYTLVVQGLDGDLAGERAEKGITFGTTHASLGLFRPEANKQNVIGWALEKTPPLRVYLNWFPGYFRSGDAGYEIPDRWQTNNAIEVANDLAGTTIDTVAAAENDFLVYNVGNTSATLQVELAAILKNGLEDSGATTFTHYDIGEPSMAWTDRATGAAESVTGRLVEYPADTRVVYTRAEITDEPVRENYFNTVVTGSRKTVDTTPTRVTIVQGENVTFYGVTRPIATTLTGAGSACRYIPDDQIVTYIYENETLGAFTFTGCLVREFDGGYLGYANYEFGHAFTDTTAMPTGTWLLAVSAYYTTGALVERTNRTIELQVTAPPSPAPDSGGDSSVTVSGAGNITAAAGGNVAEFLFRDGAVRMVTLEAAEFAPGAAVRVTNGLAPGISGPPGCIYRTFEIDVVGAQNISAAEIVFTVPVGILQSEGMDTGDVVLQHYTDGRWVSLRTYFLGEERGAARYVAETNGFSSFAIVLAAGATCSAPREATPAATASPEATPAPMGSPETTPVPAVSPATVLPMGTVFAVAAPASTPAPAEAPGFGLVLTLVGLGVAVVLRRG